MSRPRKYLKGPHDFATDPATVCSQCRRWCCRKHRNRATRALHTVCADCQHPKGKPGDWMKNFSRDNPEKFRQFSHLAGKVRASMGQIQGNWTAESGGLASKTWWRERRPIPPENLRLAELVRHRVLGG